MNTKIISGLIFGTMVLASCNSNVSQVITNPEKQVNQTGKQINKSVNLNSPEKQGNKSVKIISPDKQVTSNPDTQVNKSVNLISPYSPSVNITGNSSAVSSVTTKTNSNGTNNITLVLNPAAFKIKSGSFDRVKSYDAFLTTNFNDPFVPGANPYGDNVIQSVDDNPAGATIVFNNVPNGGLYFAVVAGFDKPVADPTRKNIEISDPTITSVSKKWARSSNSATVTGGIITYSSGTLLSVVLDLVPYNSIGINITPQNGAATPAPVSIQ